MLQGPNHLLHIYNIVYSVCFLSKCTMVRWMPSNTSMWPTENFAANRKGIPFVRLGRVIPKGVQQRMHALATCKLYCLEYSILDLETDCTTFRSDCQQPDPDLVGMGLMAEARAPRFFLPLPFKSTCGMKSGWGTYYIAIEGARSQGFHHSLLH